MDKQRHLIIKHIEGYENENVDAMCNYLQLVDYCYDYRYKLGDTETWRPVKHFEIDGTVLLDSYELTTYFEAIDEEDEEDTTTFYRL